MFKPRENNFIKLGVNPNSITQKANEVGLDTTALFQAGINAIEKKLVSDDEMLFMKLKGESERLHQEYMTKLSDKELYRNTNKLKEVQDEYLKNKEILETKIAGAGLLEKSSLKLNEYNKTAGENINAYYNLHIKEQQFNEQQAEINLRMFQLNDGALSSAYLGLGGVSMMESNLKDLDITFKKQIDSGVMDSLKANKSFTESLANSTIISTVNILKKGIVNSDEPFEVKLEKLKQIKEQFEDEDFIRQLAKEGSKGYKNTTFDTLNVELHDKKRIALQLLNADINSIKVAQALYKSQPKTEETISLKDKEKFRELVSGNKLWEAMVFGSQKKGFEIPYNNMGDYIINNIQNNSFDVNLKDFVNNNNGEIPNISLSDNNKQTLSQIMSSPNDPNLTIDENLDNKMDNLFTSVGMMLGLDPNEIGNRSIIAKTIISTGLESNGEFQGEMPPQLLLYYANKDNFDGGNIEVIKRNYINRHFENNIDTAKEVVLKTKEKDLEEVLTALQQKGIAIPEDVVKGKDNLWFEKGFIFDNTIPNTQFGKEKILNSINKYFSNLKLDKSQRNINLEKELKSRQIMDNLSNNPILSKYIQDKAIALYNQKYSDKIKSGEYPTRISRKQITNDDCLGQAISDYVTSELDKEYKKNIKINLLQYKKLNELSKMLNKGE